ncbi:MAG: hypothetical protein LW832_08295 [Parachlamydia sp.]|nr:hypothetical protein [Parachlamydia sp.]
MTRKKKDPLRQLTVAELDELGKISRSLSLPSNQIIRAKILLAVSVGVSYQEAAWLVGRSSALAVSKLVSRFNKEGIKALCLLHGGGPKVIYGVQEKKKILSIILAPPDRKKDGTATWSLKTLQKRLKETEVGLVSTYTIWKILHNSSYSFQKDRTWIKTGIVNRKRGGKSVEVEDPDAEAKKN